MKLVLKCTALILATLLAGCTTENQRGEGTEVDPGGNPDIARREVLLSLKNKLALKPESAKADTKADTPIATAEENSISTLDVYVFAAATEEGTYTFQERFAYRADGSELPADASELELTPGKTETETTGLLNLKKGLFVKLYCVANQPSLVNPADGQPVGDAAFVPLTFSDEGKQGTGIATAGQPDETTFLSFHTPLLKEDAADDILYTPLAMSGAYTTPIDLTDFNSSARIQAGFKLTRLAARFDIVNKAGDSRFTIETVSMGNGRRGATFFPIRIYGETPTANTGELITYPERAFDGDNANTGTQTGAFYAYPSPQKDNGFMILKGKYRVNQTESEQVTYKVPFVQQAPDGTSTSLEINNNHRYTIGITKADDYHLDFTLTVDDWADDGSIDEYEPEKGDGKITITIPPAFDGDTQYKEETKTVTMSLKDGSTFDAALETTSALTIQKTYAGGLEGKQYDWLDISEPKIEMTTKAAVSKYTYTFTKKNDYNKSRFPRTTVRFINVMDGSELVLFVEAIAAPQPTQTAQTEGNRNKFDVDKLEATLYRVTGSQVKVGIVCLDGTTLDTAPEWLNVKAVETGTTSTTYQLTLKDEYRDTEVEGNQGTVTFKNSKEATLKTDITVKLLDASIAPNFEALGGTGNSFTPVAGSTPADVSMQFSKSNTFTISSFSLDGVKTGMEFGSGPAWLKNNGVPATKAGSVPNDIKFTLADDVLATATAQPQKATITLQNTSGGKDYTFTVTPKFLVPATTLVSGSNNPVQNSFEGTTVTLYQTTGSQIQLKVSGLGGSAIQDATGVTINDNGNGSYAKDNTYTVTLTNNTITTGSFSIVNKSDPTKKTNYTINVPLYKAPTYTADNPSPSQNSLSGSTIKMYKVSGSRIRIKASSVGGNYIKSSSGVSISGGDGSTSQDNYYTVTWDGNASTGSLVIANKSDDRRETTLSIDFPSAAMSYSGNTTILAKSNTNNNLTITAPEGMTASVTNWGGGGEWFTITNNAQSGNGTITLVQGNINSVTIKPATLKLTNKISSGGDQTITVTPTFEAPTLSATSGTLDNVINENTTSTTFTVTVAGGYEYAIDNDGTATLSQNGNTITVTAKNKGTATIHVRNKSDNTKVANYSITVNRDYQGKAVWKYYGFYIAPEDAGKSTWDTNLTANYCSNKFGATWYVPNDAEWRTILGGTVGMGNASSTVCNEYKSKGVFASGTSYWSTTEDSSAIAYGMVFYSSYAYVDVDGKSTSRQVRCVSR